MELDLFFHVMPDRHSPPAPRSLPRRAFLSNAALLPVLTAWASARPAAAHGQPKPGSALRPLKPPRLRPGDTVGIVAPASATFQEAELAVVRESLEALGLTVKVGRHVMNRYGSLGGADADRAADINGFFADPMVKAVVPTRGGWGSARLLPLLNYDQMRRAPKILVGYSDITALLCAIHAKTGLVTFHGPNGGGRWDAYSLEFFRRVLFDAEAVTFSNPKSTNDRNVLTQIADRIRTITPGRARGRLVGGNLSVLTTIAGSPYVPSLDRVILFIEDVSEQYYRVDRMMTQLKLSGWLDRLAGFVFGTCSQCAPGEGFASFTLEEILNDYIRPLKVPAWQGAMIGHDMSQWTLPLGLEVEIDATAGSLRMVEPAVD